MSLLMLVLVVLYAVTITVGLAVCLGGFVARSMMGRFRFTITPLKMVTMMYGAGLGVMFPYLAAAGSETNYNLLLANPAAMLFVLNLHEIFDPDRALFLSVIVTIYAWSGFFGGWGLGHAVSWAWARFRGVTEPDADLHPISPVAGEPETAERLAS